MSNKLSLMKNLNLMYVDIKLKLKSKEKAWTEMWDRKYMFGDKFTFGFTLEWSKHAQKRSTRKNIYCTLSKGQLSTLQM